MAARTAALSSVEPFPTAFTFSRESVLTLISLADAMALKSLAHGTSSTEGSQGPVAAAVVVAGGVEVVVVDVVVVVVEVVVVVGEDVVGEDVDGGLGGVDALLCAT